MPEAFSHMTLGLGWKTRLDLDSSIIMLDSKGEVVDRVFFNKKTSDDGAIRHAGDNRTGEGSGDDERIEIYLDKIQDKVDSIWPVINIYDNGKQFDDVDGAYCRLFQDKHEFCRFNLS